MTLFGLQIYTAQSQIGNVINADFLGLYELAELPDYHKPTTEAIAFAGRLIDRVLQAGDVQLVITDATPNSHAVMTDAERVPGRLAFLLGPTALEHILDGRVGADSWLWHKGAYPDDLFRVA